MSEGYFKSFLERQQRSLASVTAGLCGCWKCVAARDEVRVQMILCPKCGNKRCPKASDHTNPCTGSNEPGQTGSFYR